MSTTIRMGLRPDAPDEMQAMWKTEGKANRALRKQWNKQEHYFQVEEPFGPITFRDEDTRRALVVASGPSVPTVAFFGRRGAAKDQAPIVIDGEPGTVRYPSGIRRTTRRYDIRVGDRHWFAERRRLGRVIFGRADTRTDLFCEVVSLGLLARVSGHRQRYAPIHGALHADGDPTDMAVLALLRFVGWGSLWPLRIPTHPGHRLSGNNIRART